jgi:DNA-binding NarL/FixJ family response regulator
MENGALGYMTKEADDSQLIEALRSVSRGELYLAPGLSRGILHRLGRGDDDPYERLTTREWQVLQLIAEGRTNREVADSLELSVKTVDTHRMRLMRKLNIHDQTALVKYALRKGIISLR